MKTGKSDGMITRFTDMVITIATKNIDKGGGPFAALVVREGKIISKSGNQVTLRNDPTAHAEILALRKAAGKLGTWNLSGCELYASCEPCPMCLGAIYWAHISQVYYACSRQDAAAAGFDDDFIYHEIALPPQARKIKMHHVAGDAGLKCFEKWNHFSGKVIY
jgi:guanine deaminase